MIVSLTMTSRGLSMKLLINLCAHDGVCSRYTGVGTMLLAYVDSIVQYVNLSKHDITLNLITPEYKKNSFGFNRSVMKKNEIVLKKLNGSLFMISNGTNGAKNYGNVGEWDLLCRNTADLINSQKSEKYDLVVNIYNDTPFAELANYLHGKNNILNVWIPHSTVKIHGVDSAIKDGSGYKYFSERLEWEHGSIEKINNTKNCYVGVIGKYITSHLINEYNLHEDKSLDIYNGIILDKSINHIGTKVNDYLDYDERPIILSFARAESYKNLEFSINLSSYMPDFQVVVIAQSYYSEQPILSHYRKLVAKTDATLIIDPPFDLPFAIMAQNKPMVVLVPSKKEIMGLIINEVRVMNNPNILLVSSNVGGLEEQIKNGDDGILVNAETDDYSIVADEIRSNFNEDKRRFLTINGYKRVTNDYNIAKNFANFMDNVISIRKLGS